MAAPPTGQPVTVTVGTVWKLHFQPPPPRPPTIPGKVLIIWIILTMARVIVGVVYFTECPQQPNIPNYLLGLALIPLMMIPFVNLPFESRQLEHPRGFKACLMVLISLFIFIWIVLGDVWVFSIYQPNYDSSTADGLYCNKTLYMFAFWSAVHETFVMAIMAARLCKGLLCFVNLNPVPGDTNFYRNI